MRLSVCVHVCYSDRVVCVVCRVLCVSPFISDITSILNIHTHFLCLPTDDKKKRLNSSEIFGMPWIERKKRNIKTIWDDHRTTWIVCLCAFMGDMKERKKTRYFFRWSRCKHTHTHAHTKWWHYIFLLIRFVRLVGLTAQSIYTERVWERDYPCMGTCIWYTVINECECLCEWNTMDRAIEWGCRMDVCLCGVLYISVFMMRMCISSNEQRDRDTARRTHAHTHAHHV